MTDNKDLVALEKQLVPMRPDFERVLPPVFAGGRRGDMSDRLIRTIIVSCEQTPKLLQADRGSLFRAAHTAAVLGLECDGVTGQGYLIPFAQRGGLRVVFVPGYKGYVTQAARATFTLQGTLAREGDELEIALGLEPKLHHKPSMAPTKDRKIIGAYAVARSRHYPPLFAWLTIDEIEAHRDRSSGWQAYKAGKIRSSTWASDFGPMARKTPMRVLAKDLPAQSLRLSAALEEQIDLGHQAYLRDDQTMSIDGQESPYPERQPEPEMRDITPGPTEIAAELSDGTRRTFATIEEWRGFVVDGLTKVRSPDKLEAFIERNRDIMSALAVDYEADVQAVEALFDDKREALKG